MAVVLKYDVLGNDVEEKVESRGFVFRRCSVSVGGVIIGRPSTVMWNTSVQHSVRLIDRTAEVWTGRTALMGVRISLGEGGFALTEEGCQAGVRLCVTEETIKPPPAVSPQEQAAHRRRLSSPCGVDEFG